MASVGAFEAKTHLAQLLDRVAAGERITITRHGVPAAELVPISGAQTRPRLTHEEIMHGFEKLRRRVRPESMSIRQLIDEGRR